jgi:hypothetical protein
MPASPNSPAPSGSPTGSKTKAERLFDLSLPDGPSFPLDEDTVAELAPYPGDLPTSAEHFCDLLPAVPWDPDPDLD